MAKIPVDITTESFGKVVHLLNYNIQGDIVEIGIFTCDHGKSLEKHDHENRSELCYLLKGSAIFEIEGKKTLIKEGEMILLPAHKKHLSYPADESSDFTSVYIVYKE